MVASAFYKLRGDIALSQGDSAGAVKYYRKAQSNADGSALQTRYKLDIAAALIAQDNYDDARETLDEILNNEDIGFNEKNIAEELMGFVSQKLGI